MWTVSRGSARLAGLILNRALKLTGMIFSRARSELKGPLNLINSRHKIKKEHRTLIIEG